VDKQTLMEILKESVFLVGAGMANRLDALFREWYQLGGRVLLAESIPTQSVRAAEVVIAESTAHCRESGRLTWVVLDWLIREIERIDVDALLRETQAQGDLSVLGVVCDAARQRNPHPAFDALVAACRPHDRLEIFFYRVARSPLASRLTVENALPLFRRWNYLCNELRYFADRAEESMIDGETLAKKSSAVGDV
jgi:hypothetical protein